MNLFFTSEEHILLNRTSFVSSWFCFLRIELFYFCFPLQLRFAINSYLINTCFNQVASTSSHLLIPVWTKLENYRRRKVILYQQDVVKYDYSEGGSESEIFANLYFGV